MANGRPATPAKILMEIFNRWSLIIFPPDDRVGFIFLKSVWWSLHFLINLPKVCFFDWKARLLLSTGLSGLLQHFDERGIQLVRIYSFQIVF